MLVLTVITAAIVAAVTIAAVLLLRRTKISVVIRRDPDMNTIKQRLAALEASAVSMATTIASIGDQLAAHGSTLDGTATSDQLAALGQRVANLSTTVEGISAEIGTDAVADPAPVDELQGSMSAAAAAANRTTTVPVDADPSPTGPASPTPSADPTALA